MVKEGCAIFLLFFVFMEKREKKTFLSFWVDKIFKKIGIEFSFFF